MQETKSATRSAGSVALGLTRVLAAAMAVLVFAQGTLAGSHLSGADGALDAHRALGTEIIPWLSLATAVAAAVSVRRNRWVLSAALLAAVGTGTQIGMGFQDRLDVHFPLGLALLATYLVIALAARDRTEKP
ncbi:MAG: hypothetical protein ACLFWM_12225 [Actinomycetota bacterium]